ncbi:putative cation-transporting ATPase [Smittium mucronatum]|uniref:Plasma membrane ATPase n=1 Tax=Smittium mucronatum TaxID=133383 RepID=A0A1R0H4C9_9FUNG|nr:putative cation-transporting ATPase [Smittium mucronatum]
MTSPRLDLSYKFPSSKSISSEMTTSDHREPKKADIPKNSEIPPELEPLLDTDYDTGLSNEEYEKRLATFGNNEIAEKKKNKLLHFLSFFGGSIAFLIDFALILTAITKDWVNFAIIGALLFLNAFIGWFEESKAENAVDSLKNSLALKSKVWRDSELVDVDSKFLVPGDIIVVRLGDIVPADALLLGIGVDGSETEVDLLVDQAGLTGESLPVQKSKGDMIYSSSVVKQGQMKAIVVKTGEHTFIGKAASLIAITNEPGHFQVIINTIGNFLVYITIVMVLVIFIFLLVKRIGFNNGKLSKEDLLSSLEDVVVLTVAAIPVGLPTVLSVTMAVGSNQLAKKNVIVKRLTAVEEMASISILCSDKTGTLTLNKLTFDEPFLKNGFKSNDILFYAYLAAEPATADPIESAVRTAATTQVPVLQDLPNHKVPGYKVLAFTPFNPSTKMTKAKILDEKAGTSFRVAKGAPQVIISLCNGDDEATNMVNQMASRGFRALGVAINHSDNEESGWELVGLISLLDPPRPDSADTINKCHDMGISVKMITGDQMVIAKEVANRLGMHQVILSAEKLVDSDITEEQRRDRCFKADGFSEVVPEHKFMIIDALQKKGNIVGMTGDGVNDAPALKKSNVGIAVHGSTDAARAAADIILLESGLSSIIDGVLVSRAIFQRMRSYALYRITSTIHFLIFFFIITLAFNWKMSPSLLILIAVLNDAATIVIAFDNAQVSKTPDKWRIGQLITLSVILGSLLSVLSFAVFFVARDAYKIPVHSLFKPKAELAGLDHRMQSIIYLNISSAPHFVIFSTRLSDFFFMNVPSFTFSFAVISTQVFATILCSVGIKGFVDKIGFAWGFSLLGISFIFFVILDVVKVYVMRFWSFELVATLWPTKAHRTKIRKRVAQNARLDRVSKTVQKIRATIIANQLIEKGKRV